MKTKVIIFALTGAILAGGLISCQSSGDTDVKPPVVENDSTSKPSVEEDNTDNPPDVEEDTTKPPVVENNTTTKPSVVENNTTTKPPSVVENDNISKPPVDEDKPIVEDSSINKPTVEEEVLPPPTITDITQLPSTGGSNAEISNEFMAEVEQAIFNKVNEERIKAGVAPLTYNKTMEKYARIKSEDMGLKNYFSHEDLNGDLITKQMLADGVTYRAWGENIAYISGYGDIPEVLANKFMTNWMNSKGHRENILATKFTSIGVGIYKIGNIVYATQEFYK